MKKIILFLLLISNILNAQNFSVFPKKNYPTNQFKNPFNFPISLAGNYGECRPNHFHSGIDIRTDGVENKPVHAIKNGYISRIKISSTGFGNAIYITHPNGYTSLYAHLKKFNKQIAAWVEFVQYKEKKWDIDTQPQAWELPITDSELIAFSGNTGSSAAPHLHLEIRDTKTENTLNPLLFGFEINDNIKPEIYGLGVYDFSDGINFYNAEKKYLSVKGSNGNYNTDNIIQVPFDKVAFSTYAIDFINDRKGKLGVFETQIYVDGKLNFAWQVDDISYDNTRYLHAFADYPMYISKNKWYECAFLLPDNQLKIYLDPLKTRGIVDLKDNNIHKIQLKLYDTKGNLSVLNFNVQKSTGMSNSIKCTDSKSFEKEIIYTNNDMKVDFTPKNFYDNVCFSISKNGEVYTIGKKEIPVHEYYSMWLEPSNSLSNKDKLIVQKVDNDGKAMSGKKAFLENNMVKTEGFRELGNFKISMDFNPPLVSSTLKNNITLKNGSKINFNVEEKETSIKNFEVKANNQWLCFIRYKNSFYYTVDGHMPKGKVTIKMTTSDENDNVNTQSYIVNIL